MKNRQINLKKENKKEQKFIWIYFSIILWNMESIKEMINLIKKNYT